jgi:hypothetical protein
MTALPSTECNPARVYNLANQPIKAVEVVTSMRQRYVDGTVSKSVWKVLAALNDDRWRYHFRRQLSDLVDRDHGLQMRRRQSRRRRTEANGVSADIRKRNAKPNFRLSLRGAEQNETVGA